MDRQSQGGFLIAKIHQLSNRIFSRILKQANLDDLNPAQGRIMFVLWQKDNISINELAKKTMLSKSALTSMLDRLENAGFIERDPSEKDRREILLKLTEQNKNLEGKYVGVSREMTDLFYKSFSAVDIDEFEETLKKILKNLTEYEEKSNK